MNQWPDERSPLNSAEYEHILGVFRTQEQANAAIAALRQGQFAENNVFVTAYHPQRTEDSRFLVHVTVPSSDEARAAVGILASQGANNADLPPNTAIVHGDLAFVDPGLETPLAQPSLSTGPDSLVQPPDITEHRG